MIALLFDKTIFIAIASNFKLCCRETISNSCGRNTSHNKICGGMAYVGLQLTENFQYNDKSIPVEK